MNQTEKLPQRDNELIELPQCIYYIPTAIFFSFSSLSLSHISAVHTRLSLIKYHSSINECICCFHKFLERTISYFELQTPATVNSQGAREPKKGKTDPYLMKALTVKQQSTEFEL